MTRSEKNLKSVVDGLKARNKPGISLFITGGYPDMNRFIRILRLISDHHLADFVEIGIPFSDPVADGPVIQESSRVAIEKGVNFRDILAALRQYGDKLDIPLVLMAYMNTLYAGGLEKNLLKARQAGFDSMIIPDLPVDESGEVLPAASKTGIDVVFLASPASSAARIKAISEKSSPFLYYVSRFGTTGARKELAAGIQGRLRTVSKNSRIPVYCGFGISTPRQAALVGRHADGIIIGSALTKIIRDTGKDYLEEIRKFAISIRREITGKGAG